MLGQKHILILLAVLVAVSAMFLISGSGSDSLVSLEASADKATYQSGEEITLSLRLNNTGAVATCVSDMVPGTVRFTSFTRDGEGPETRTATSYFLASLPEMLAANLESIAPDKGLDIVFSSEFDAGLGGQALRTTALDDSRGLATFYDVATPGAYELELSYEYSGPESNACATIFEKQTNTATVSFTVTP